MSFIGVRDALLTRLTGRRHTDVGVNLTGVRGQGLTAPMRNQRNLGVPSSGIRAIGEMTMPGTPTMRGMKVPVIPYDIAGRNFSERPCLSVYMPNVPRPRRDESYLFHDPIRRDIASSMVDVETDDGETARGPSLNKTRPHPDPIDYTFALRVWATSETEAILIYERVLDLLKDRGYLDVVLRDGTTATYDTEMAPVVVPIDVPAGIEDAGDAGDYSLVVEYSVEGYADNSDVETLNYAIQQRSLVMAEHTDEEDVDEAEIVLDGTAALADS